MKNDILDIMQLGKPSKITVEVNNQQAEVRGYITDFEIMHGHYGGRDISISISEVHKPVEKKTLNRKVLIL